MKHKLSILVLMLLLAVSCSTSDDIILLVSNPHHVERTDATILINRDMIASWTEIPDGVLPLLLDIHQAPIKCQVDDVNRDGTWDELYALADLPASGQIKVILRFVPSGEYPEFESRTNLRLGDATRSGYPELLSANRLEGISYHNYDHVTGAAFQMEGPAWENDRVGFRNYLDQRNGIDIFGKTVDTMVLDSVGIKGGPSYHEPDTWGMDVLKVGTSLGAGAIGYQFRDSIYRVGDNGSGTYDVLFEGSQRSRFNLNYSNWMVEETPLEVIHQIEITGGRHFYQGTVTYKGSKEDLDLVTGIVNMKSDEVHVVDLDPNHMAIITHDLQSEDTTYLAMAVLVPRGYLVETGESPNTGDGITQTYYVVLESSENDAAYYRFYSLWEREDPAWTSLQNVVDFLKIEAERWTQSVVIEVLR